MTNSTKTVCWHLLVVTALSVAAAAMFASTPDADASIGGGLVGLVVVTAGLPWSLVALFGIDVDSSVVVMAPVWLSAVLNAFLLFALLRARERRADGSRGRV